MKQLFFLLLLASAFASAQIVNIPDANFKAALLAASPSNPIASTQTPNAFGNVTTYNTIDTNGDGEIQESEAAAITYLSLYQSSLSNITGIQSFTSLKTLNCALNSLTSLDVSGLTNLQTLDCYGNYQLTTLNVSGLTNLDYLYCIECGLTTLNVSGLTNLKTLWCGANQLPTLDVSGLTNLKELGCGTNDLTTLDVSSCANLQTLYCDNNQLTTLDVSSLTNLQYLSCAFNQLTSLNVSPLTNLQTLHCAQCGLTTLNVSDLTNLQNLYCDSNHLTSLDVSPLINLKNLNCSHNPFSALDVSSCTNLQYLECTSNQLTSLDVSALTNLQTLRCGYNTLTTLDLSGLTNLQTLDFKNNPLTSLDASGCTNLQILNCGIWSDNYLTSLTSLNVSGCTNLHYLNCPSNLLTTLDVSGCTNLQTLSCHYNLLTTLDVSSCSNLYQLSCNSNQLTSLNVSGCTNLHYLSCDNNQLTSLFIKNGASTYVDFDNNPNLHYICADEGQIATIQQDINDNGYASTCTVNSYCSFTPGGTSYTISGNTRWDTDANGCDTNDTVYPNLKFNITDGYNAGTLITDTSGNYSIPVAAGTHTVTPVLENPNYFSVSPASLEVTFPAAASPFIQNFCVTANGVHPDLEVSLLPLLPARPGFDATYKIIYKNKGNQVENATLVLNYNDAVLDYVASTLAPTTQNNGSLSWTIGTLTPFQTGEFVVTLNVNSPMENPAINGGDILSYTATINGLNADETPADNTFGLNQTVVNSYYPNDKICLEGSTINPDRIGGYVHYKIHFENTGTFPAQNIVVKDMIDTTQFDVSTLQIEGSSHSCYARIKDNKVEFVFENINLPFDDATNDGYVVFKIKTLPTLAANSTISNTADIFFDYIFPITTNTAASTFTTLGNTSFEKDNIVVYPNPANAILNIKIDTAIQKIEIYDTLGRLVQTTTSPTSSIAVSQLLAGNYFMKIYSDKKISNARFTKK